MCLKTCKHHKGQEDPDNVTGSNSPKSKREETESPCSKQTVSKTGCPVFFHKFITPIQAK